MKKQYLLPFIFLFFACQEPMKSPEDTIDRYQMSVIDKGPNLRPDIFVIDKVSGKTYVRDGNSSIWIEIGSPKQAIMQKY
jgi:hypothetical protein